MPSVVQVYCVSGAARPCANRRFDQGRELSECKRDRPWQQIFRIVLASDVDAQINAVVQILVRGSHRPGRALTNQQCCGTGRGRGRDKRRIELE